MARPLIEDLEWDDENEAHVAEHIDPDLVVAMAIGQDWVQIANAKRHPSQRVRLVGKAPNGQMVTAVFEPTRWPGTWRPVTGWPSTRGEITLYEKGRKHRRG